MIKNLVYNADIKRISTKQSINKDELELIQQANLSESIIQQTCKRIFEEWLLDNKLKGMFIQIDNGGKASIAQKVKKKLEGTVEGMCDVLILVSNAEGKTYEAFIEFKRIGSPSQVKPRDSQIETHNKLLELGYIVHLTNNTVFFKNSILKEITLYFHS